MHIGPWGRRTVTMGNNLENIEQQNLFLHREVRLPRVEILDMLCDRLGMSKTRLSYRKLNCLQWTIGQKLTTRAGATFWATDSRYLCPTSEDTSRRREIFLLRGTEIVQVKLPNGAIVAKNTALCCEAVCFITIHHLLRLHYPLPTGVVTELENGAYDLMH